MKTEFIKINLISLLFLSVFFFSGICRAADAPVPSSGGSAGQDPLQGLSNLGLGGLGGGNGSTNSNTQDWLNSYIQQKNDQQNQASQQNQQMAEQQKAQLDQLQLSLGQISAVVKKIAIINLITVLLAWIVLSLGAAALIKYLKPSLLKNREHIYPAERSSTQYKSRY